MNKNDVVMTNNIRVNNMVISVFLRFFFSFFVEISAQKKSFRGSKHSMKFTSWILDRYSQKSGTARDFEFNCFNWRDNISSLIPIIQFYKEG